MKPETSQAQTGHNSQPADIAQMSAANALDWKPPPFGPLSEFYFEAD